MPQSKELVVPCHLVLASGAATPVQRQAWRQLWARLLSDGQTEPETRQPQEETPGATTSAAVASGRHIWSECRNDSTNHSEPQ